MPLSCRSLLILLAFAASALTASCIISGRAFVSAEPELVSVSPGVWVVGDYHEPVFFHSGMYWRYYGGVWYRSSVHTGGWVLVNDQYVPPAIIRIDGPRRYIRYRARPGVRVRRGPRGKVRHYQPRNNERVKARRGAPPRTRDHRSQPKVRDHRSEPKVRDHRDKKKGKKDKKRRDWR